MIRVRLLRARAARQDREMEHDDLVRRVRAEFLEMPGLRLTPRQATRLWGLEHEQCQAVIALLIGSAFLRYTATGAIARAQDD